MRENAWIDKSCRSHYLRAQRLKECKLGVDKDLAVESSRSTHVDDAIAALLHHYHKLNRFLRE